LSTSARYEYKLSFAYKLFNEPADGGPTSSIGSTPIRGG
jgi:hypothetical protein